MSMHSINRRKVVIFPALLAFAILASCTRGIEWISDARSNCHVELPADPPGDSISYEGDCVNGFAHGKGIVRWYLDTALQAVVHGNFAGGRLHGACETQYTHKDGDSFTAEYRHGLLHGNFHRKYYWGKEYQAKFANGELNSAVTIRWPNGKRYEGEAHDSQYLDGRGTMFFPGGDRYEGQIRNNRRHGKGVYYWANGDRYEGRYINDRRTPEGRYVSAGGSEYSGELIAVDSSGKAKIPHDSIQVELELYDICEPYLDLPLLQSFVVYPEAGVRANQEGQIRIRILIDEQGNQIEHITEAEDFDENFVPLFSEAALKALEQIRFEPAREEGRYFKCWVMVPITFRFR